MDEARFGQKGRVCHRWFTRGERPPGLCDQRYTWTHLFAAVRPATGDGFALVLPQVSTAAMNEFLAQFAATLAEDEHAVMVLDRAGWHRAKKLVVPSNITLVWLPPYSPQLNPVERVWLFLREKHLSHRLLDTYDAIVGALCRAWNALTKRAPPIPHQLPLSRTDQDLSEPVSVAWGGVALVGPDGGGAGRLPRGDRAVAEQRVGGRGPAACRRGPRQRRRRGASARAAGEELVRRRGAAARPALRPVARRASLGLARRA